MAAHPASVWVDEPPRPRHSCLPSQPCAGLWLFGLHQGLQRGNGEVRGPDDAGGDLWVGCVLCEFTISRYVSILELLTK